MKVSFFDLKRLYRLTEDDVNREIRHVLESGYYILGSYCEKFEIAMQESMVNQGQGFVIGCNSGTDAIVLSLLAMDIGAGDEVITPSHTAIPTITAIRSTGATPVFCDIDPDTWLIDIKQVPKLVTSKTKAVISVHLYGNMVDIPQLRSLLKAHSQVKIIEDVAQAQGSTWKTESGEAIAGTLGDFGSFSFYPTKNLGALGDAGAVFTKDAQVAEKIKMLRFYGQKDRYNAKIDRGVNSRLDEMQAAILLSRMKFMPRWQKKKTEMVDYFNSELDGLPIKYQKVDSKCTPNWHLYVVQTKTLEERNQLQSKLGELGVQTLIHYPIPTHKQVAFSAYSKIPLPITEKTADTILSLPMNVTLTQEEAQYTVNSLKKALGG